MRKNPLLNKSCIVIIVFLFIGVSSAPIIIGEKIKVQLDDFLITSDLAQYSVAKSSYDKTYHDIADELSSVTPLPWWNRWPNFPGRYEPFFEVHDIKDFGQAAWGLTSADFNKDGKLDFAVSWATSPWTQSTISLFYSDGDGGFTQDDVYTITTPELRYFSDLKSEDYDDDGDIDILFAYDNKYTDIGTVSLLFNDGNNHFGNAMIIAVLTPTGYPGRNNPQLCSADFDNDGDLDFLVGDNSGLVEFYMNNGTGNFSCAAIYDFGGKMSWGLSSGDFNNDGNLDFIVTQLTSWPSSESGCIYLVWNDGTPNCFNQSLFTKIADLTPLSSFFTSVIWVFGCLCSIDYNNDGLMDFIFAGSDSIFLYMQNETGVFDYFHLMTLPMPNAKDGGWYIDDLRNGGITVGDFNSDGLEDMVIGGVQGVARICYNKRVLVDIVRPDNTGFFISDKQIRKYGLLDPIMIYRFIKQGISVAIGDLTVKAKGLVPLQKVEFYIGRKLVYTDNTAPYEWNWISFSFGRHKIKAVAYDLDGKQVGSDDAIVWKYF